MARRSKNAKKFSHAWIDGIPRQTTRREWIDSDCDGLALRVGTSGSKIFYFLGRLNGRVERSKLGEYPHMPLAEARREVKHMLGQAAIGKPAKPRAMTVRDEITLGDLFEWYLRTHAKPQKRTWEADESRYKRVLAKWSSKPLSAITTAMVKDLHIALGDADGPYAANKMLELLGFMWRLGREQLAFDAPDPTRGLLRYPKKDRERFLDKSELPKFFEALAKLPKETTRDFIMICLLTGGRRSNVAAMRWRDVNLADGVWEVEADQSKNKRSMRIILPTPAVLVLERRREAAEKDAEWVFPGGGRTGHIVEPKHAMATIRDKSGIKDLRLHDLRRTLGSWQAALGTSLPIIGKSLGHTSIQATRIYARLDLDPVRASVQAAADQMMASNPKRLPAKKNGKEHK